ncbi:MAG: P63C domain-containing protein [Terricaulis sp.]
MAAKKAVKKSAQSKGGEARALVLSPAERREIAVRAAKTRWTRVNDPSQLSTASHRGSLPLGEIEVDVYRLKDGRRFISKKGMATALGLQSAGGNAFLRSITRKGLRSQISLELWDKINKPISFKVVGDDPKIGKTSAVADGYEATTLVDVCTAIIKAHHANELHGSQYSLYVRAEIIVRASAKLGITALVDEAVGYVADHRREEYRRLFNEFLEDECRQWEQEFPKKFSDMIYRIYGLKRRDPDGTTTPRFFGNFTRKYIYYPLAHSRGAILDQLDERNPVIYSGGGRKYKFHQFLTEEIGLPALRQHLWQVIGIGNASANKDQFRRNFYRAFPESAPLGHQWELLGDDPDDA